MYEKCIHTNIRRHLTSSDCGKNYNYINIYIYHVFTSILFREVTGIAIIN